MKKMKKLLAITLSVAMICGVFAVMEPDEAEAAMPTTEYFNETFSTDGAFDNETWKTSTNDADESNLTMWESCVSEGKFTIPSTNTEALYLMANDDELLTKSDYKVSCKVQLGGTLPEDRTTVTNLGFVARTGNLGSQGYEFQLTIPETDDEQPYVRLRDRVANKYYTSVHRLSNFDYTEENLFEIECRGDVITCSINGKVCFTYTASETSKYVGYTEETDPYINMYNEGTAAIRMLSTNIGVDVIIDDFKVYHVADYKFCDDFNGYDGDATNAQKRAALLANDWWIRTNAYASMLTGDSYVVPGDYTVNPIVLQTENAKGALGWNDYSVEADITIGETGQTATSPVYACVTGRHEVIGGDDGYEIQFYDNAEGVKKLRIYARNAGSTLLQCDFPFEYGKTYNLKAVFQGNTIYAYVDDVLYLTVTDDAYPIGFAGIKKNGTKDTASGVDVKFDNFVVYDYDVVPAAFSDDFNEYVPTLVEGDDTKYDYSALQKTGWFSTNVANTRTCASYIANGVFKIPAGRTAALNMSLSSLESAVNWKNCRVECDVTFDTNSEVTGAATYVSIACREQSNSDFGYGFRVGTDTLGRIRYIQIVKNGSKVAENNIATAGLRPVAGTTVTMRLELNERTITGYLVGYEDYTVTYTIPETETVTSGYAGIHTGSSTAFDVTIDNFKVYDLDNPYVKEIVGDILVDDVVNKDDTNAVKQYLLGTELDAETHDTDALDVNKDTAKNISDYVRMLRLVDSLN